MKISHQNDSSPPGSSGRSYLLRAVRRAGSPTRTLSARLPQLAPDGEQSTYRWEFTEKGRDFAVAVPARVLSNDAALSRRLAIAGLGVPLTFEGHVRDAIERGSSSRSSRSSARRFPDTTCTTRSGDGRRITRQVLARLVVAISLPMAPGPNARSVFGARPPITHKT